ncbi:CaiB/BaiF CoA transferase family protein [Sediminicola luteus]|uniref:Carnitine dehydratase n=1 Tax=Sediminicola luteus TaxID=319238 RepID=A0A2A4G5P0_9FLAO|nr:CaiB/BaiF CoA-transferase family protein [Sediminicola luteus]PCE63743.1 hypothetical protein B7P33_10735 [Sediminicola luteus]
MQEIAPLEGLRILDFSRLLPGPLGTHFLSDMGAEVVKVEHPQRMDYTRYYEPKREGNSVMFHLMNHNKESLIVDYTTKAGKDTIMDEIKKADVLIEQFRPGAMARFGFSFEEVKRINPKIVYISITGYGQQGKKADKAGHDINYMATAGLLDLNRDEKGKPVIPGFQVADIAGGSYMLLAACTSGVLAQQRHQKAQFIDLALADATLPLASIAQGMQQGGIPYAKMPLLSGLLVNYNVYECADNKWIALGALELKFWNAFCELVGQPDWKAKSDQELIVGVFDKSKVTALFRTKTQAEWVALTEAHDVCLSPILTQAEVIAYQDRMERDSFAEISVGPHKMHPYKIPFKTYMAEDS